jgi:hypothetical protein
MHELDCNVRRIAARTAISHREHAAAASIDAGESFGGGDQSYGLLAEKAGVGIARIAGLLLDRV